MPAEASGQQVALFGLGWLAGARAASLDVNHNQWNLAHHREADGFLFKRVARP